MSFRWEDKIPNIRFQFSSSFSITDASSSVTVRASHRWVPGKNHAAHSSRRGCKTVLWLPAQWRSSVSKIHIVKTQSKGFKWQQSILGKWWIMFWCFLSVLLKGIKGKGTEYSFWKEFHELFVCDLYCHAKTKQWFCQRVNT